MEIVEIISSVGFPIAACVVMFMQNDKLQKTLQDISTTMALLSERLKDVENKIDNIEKKEKEDK